MRPALPLPSLLSRLTSIVSSFKAKDPHAGFVGYDLEGNRFYENPGQERAKRTVQYAESSPEEQFHHSDVTDGTRGLPVQWQAWMRHTRKNPPTTEELQADLQRRQTLAQKVQILEAKDREEQLRQRATAAASRIPHSPPPPSLKPQISQPSPQHQQTPETQPTPETDPLRLESQRALKEEEARRVKVGAGRGTGPESVRNPLGSGGETGGDWRPEGWKPAVGKRRGGGGN
ncbi:hypothetical protein BDY24DRAFT_375742 [Mrakia frigida]|uniref:uncharacterized protein n=1 Tax=Mrakia frigida TaxID=29902 RepID=UPI003FCC1CC6